MKKILTILKKEHKLNRNGFLQLLSLILLFTFNASKAQNRPSAYWNFDGSNNKVAIEKVSGSNDSITGYATYVKGVQGSALKFDGFTALVTHKSIDKPIDITKGFSVEAWIAPQEYSWNWTGIIDQEKDHKECFSFGIDYLGRVGLMMALDGKWQGIVSDKSVTLLKWSHVAATYDPIIDQITVYINGQPAKQEQLTGKPTPSKANFWIGMSHTKQWPELTERKGSQIPTPMVFD